MSELRPLRCVSWAAVSSAPQAKEVSNSEQCRINREHIERVGGVLIAELIVPGLSRSYVLYEDAARAVEQYAQLKELIDRSAFDVLFYLDSSRLGREDALIAAVSGLCRNAGIRLYETSSPPASLDGPVSTFDSRLLGAIKGVQAAYEVHKLKERSTMGRRARIKKGKHAGTPPYGYARVYDATGKSRVEIVPEEASAIRLFYDLYIKDGLSLDLIGKEFERRGILTRNGKTRWFAGTIRRMLMNRWAYAGYTSWGYRSKRFTHERFREKAEWEAILDEQTVVAAEQAMDRRAHARRAVRGPHRFSMLGKCAYCGSTIAVHSRIGRNRAIVDNFLCTKFCRGTHIGHPVIREALEAAIKRLQDAAFVESLIDERPDRHQELAVKRDELYKLLDKVAEERKRLTMVFTRNTIDVDEYEELMAGLKERAEALSVALQEIESELARSVSPEQQREKLQEIRDAGMQMLDLPDEGAANLWLRKVFSLEIGEYQVLAVKYL